MKRTWTLLSSAAVVATTVGVALSGPIPGPYTTAPAYVKPVSPDVKTSPIVTTGECVQLTGAAPGTPYRVLGIPDGLGGWLEKGKYGATEDRLVLLMNHEFGATTGTAAGPLPGGARVSEFRLDIHKGGKKVSAEVDSGRAFIQSVYKYDLLSDSWVLQAPGTKRIHRLCSAFMADERVGFDRPIFMHGEEQSALAPSFDGLGGNAFATFEDATYNLPGLGHISWENAVVVPGTGDQTVVFCMEDGPSSGNSLNSQLYVYVGEKDASSSDALAKNGLRGGKVYVFVGDDPAVNSEATFAVKGGSTTGTWVEVNPTLNANAYDTQAKALGAFAFVRIEDGAADPSLPGDFWFVTTGNPPSTNPNGRLYHVEFDPSDVLAGATLTLALDGTEGMVSPDNIDLNKHGEMLLCEDPNFAPPGRDSSVWSYDISTGALERIAEVDRASARAHALAADPGNSFPAASDVNGNWETSGVIDAERWLGRGAWLLDVQAHGLVIQPSAETVEGGQLLLLVFKPKGKP